MMSFSPFNTPNAKFTIERVLLSYTGTYDQATRRPLTVVASDQSILEDVTRRIESNRNQFVSAGIFTGIANQIVAPSATAITNAPIASGWGSRRFRFVIELSEESQLAATRRYILQGYTDRAEISFNNTLDPETLFFVNSYVVVSRTMQVDGNMNTFFSDRVVRSCQILDGKVISQDMTDNYYQRPKDVFEVIQSGHMENYAGQPVHDLRFSDTNAVRFNSRRNNQTNFYLEDVTSKFVEQYNMSQSGFGNDGIYSRVVNAFDDPYENEVPLFRAIDRLRGATMMASSNFRWRELERVDNTVDHKTDVITIGAVQAVPRVTSDGLPAPVGFNQYTAGNTAGWNGQNTETIVANMLTNYLPGIMLDCMVTMAWFEMTNEVPGGQATFLPKNMVSLLGSNAGPYFQTFIQRCTNDLAREISYNGMFTFRLECCIDIQGEFWMNVSINGGPMEQFVAPVFADSLFSPMINPSRQQTFALANEMEVLCNAVNYGMFGNAEPADNFAGQVQAGFGSI